MKQLVQGNTVKQQRSTQKLESGLELLSLNSRPMFSLVQHKIEIISCTSHGTREYNIHLIGIMYTFYANAYIVQVEKYITRLVHQ